jgi:inward rectifier potassium channel
MKKKEDLIQQEKNRSDLGFGSKVVNRNIRLVTNNGQFNVKRSGQSIWAWLNVYNRLITMSWAKFMVLAVSFYLVVNLLFALGYMYLGVENLKGTISDQPHNRFWDAFFFSSQTLTTVGYGHIYPYGFSVSFLAAIEALFGLMIFALVTGILYGRFSRPKASVIFSRNAVIAPYFDKNAFMFRIVNERSNQLINVKVSIVFSRIEEVKGNAMRKYYGLDLERSFVTFFPLNWTIVHPITDESPLKNETVESLRANDGEFLVAVEGSEDTFTETVHTRASYTIDDLIWGAKFKPMSEETNDGMYWLDLKKIDDYSEVPLN